MQILFRRRNHKEEHFERLFAEMYPRLVCFATTLIRNTEEAKDIVSETMEQALVRECREELDITVQVGDIFTQVIHEYPDIHIRLSLFHCTIGEGIPALLEHADLKWILPSEIPLYNFCPADKDILTLIQNNYL